MDYENYMELYEAVYFFNAECRGGKQRTKEEFVSLFLDINYGLEKTIKLTNIHTMLVMGTL